MIVLQLYSGQLHLFTGLLFCPEKYYPSYGRVGNDVSIVVLNGSLMHRCKIIYNTKPCFGYIIASTDIEPHYYWFFFEDIAYIRLYGDGIAFKLEEDRLMPTRLYCGDENFIEKIKQHLDAYRKRGAVKNSSYR